MSRVLPISISCTQLNANQKTGIRKKEKGKRNNCMVDRLKIIKQVRKRKVSQLFVIVHIEYNVTDVLVALNLQ